MSEAGYCLDARATNSSHMVECEKPRPAYMTKESGKFFLITDVHHISSDQLDSSFGGIDATQILLNNLQIE